MNAKEERMTAGAVVRRFFERYNGHDLSGMISLFQPSGTVEYVPLKLDGPVEEIGPGSWGVLMDAFPDLRNEVQTITEDASGRRAFVDVYIGGTQAKDAFGIENQGKKYWVRHMFVFDVADDGHITHVTSYWDNADWYKQLGKNSID